MELLENILIVAAWVFLGISVILIVSGIWIYNKYEGSLNQAMDKVNGEYWNFMELVRIGIPMLIISLIILTAIYLM